MVFFCIKYSCKVLIIGCSKLQGCSLPCINNIEQWEKLNSYRAFHGDWPRWSTWSCSSIACWFLLVQNFLWINILHLTIHRNWNATTRRPGLNMVCPLHKGVKSFTSSMKCFTGTGEEAWSNNSYLTKNCFLTLNISTFGSIHICLHSGFHMGAAL